MDIDSTTDDPSLESAFHCCCFVSQPKDTTAPSLLYQPLLPTIHKRKAEKPLVILDLDQTLIHSVHYDEFMIYKTFNTHRQPRVDFRLVLKDGSDFVVSIRPGLDEFLRFVFANFRVGIWTAAQKEYATEILQRIMTPLQYNQLAFIFTSRECAWTKKYTGPTKPAYRILQLLPDLDLTRTILCDDNHLATADFAENTVLVQPYSVLESNADLDQEFERLSRYLEQLFHPVGKHKDVRLRHAYSRGKRDWRATVGVAV